jgi:hypothetical protein
MEFENYLKEILLIERKCWSNHCRTAMAYGLQDLIYVLLVLIMMRVAQPYR